MSEERVQQAVEYIEALRDGGVCCEFREEEYFNEKYIGEHTVFAFPSTKPLQFQSGWIERLLQLNENEVGRAILREAFEIVKKREGG